MQVGGLDDEPEPRENPEEEGEGEGDEGDVEDESREDRRGEDSGDEEKPPLELTVSRLGPDGPAPRLPFVSDLTGPAPTHCGTLHRSQTTLREELRAGPFPPRMSPGSVQ